MVFWFFGKNVSKKAFDKFKKSLDSSLNSSFSNIRRDIQRTKRTLNELSSEQKKQIKVLQAIRDSLGFHDAQLKEEIIQDVLANIDLDSKLKELKSMFRATLDEQFVHLANEQSELKKRLHEAEKLKKQVFVDRSSVRSDRSLTVRQPPNNEYSELHLEILKKIMLLQKSLQLRWISMKDLAREIYPGIPYRRVKSTLSEYLSELHQAGLIEKRYQRRNRLFVSYTEKALRFAKNGMIAKMRSLISSEK